MNISLNDISEIKLGFPGLPEAKGSISFLQLRQFNDDGILFSDHLQAVVNPQSDEEKTKLKHARRGDANVSTAPSAAPLRWRARSATLRRSPGSARDSPCWPEAGTPRS